MSILLLFAAAIAPDPAAADVVKARPCSLTARGISQIAYAPYGSGVFGSDGLACTTAKPGPGTKTPASARARETRPTPVLRGIGQKP